MMVFVGIGNSDNKLSQAGWSEFVAEVERAIRSYTDTIHGAWFSRPDAPWQNCCWCFEIDSPELLKPGLASIGRAFSQDSIAWSVAETEFI